MRSTKKRQLAVERELLELRGEVFFLSQVSAMLLSNIVACAEKPESVMSELRAAVDDICTSSDEAVERDSTEYAKQLLSEGQRSAAARVLQHVEISLDRLNRAEK